MTVEIRPDVLDLARQAAEWRLIAMLLDRPAAGWQEQLDGAAAEVDDAELRRAVEAARHEAGEGLYHTTFGPGGPAAPREVGYRQTVHPGAFLAELMGCYQAFAYAAPTREPPDHVAVEADFLSFLKLKEAYARSSGRGEQAEIAAEAARGFLEDHLSRIAEPLAEALACSGIEYLALATAALARRVGPPRTADGPGDPLEVLPADCEMECTIDAPP